MREGVRPGKVNNPTYSPNQERRQLQGTYKRQHPTTVVNGSYGTYTIDKRTIRVTWQCRERGQGTAALNRHFNFEDS